MDKKKFKINPKVWPKEYTFEEFKRLNPNINESVLINYYNKYLQEYAENYSRHIKHFEDTKKILTDNIQEVKSKYLDTQYFLKMYYGSDDPTAAGAGSYPIFTPTDISGLINWYDATEGITLKGGAGTEVSEWKSKVGTNHLVESGSLGGVGGSEPVLNSEGDAVEFPSGNTNDALSFTTPLSLGAFTMFFVLRLQTDTGRYYALFRGESANANMYLFGASSDMFFTMGLDDGGGDTDSISIGQMDNDIADDTKVVFVVTKDAAENARVKIYVNNVDSFPQGGGGGSDALDKNIPFTPAMFGMFNGAGRHLNGEVFEFGIYDRFLSDTDIKQLYYYLGIKHNIPGYDGPSELRPYNWLDSNYGL